jgi:hypothetical protein
LDGHLPGILNNAFAAGIGNMPLQHKATKRNFYLLCCKKARSTYFVAVLFSKLIATKIRLPTEPMPRISCVLCLHLQAGIEAMLKIFQAQKKEVISLNYNMIFFMLLEM